MPGSQDLLNIIELIQGFIPKVKFEFSGFTGISLEELKLQLGNTNNVNTYNAININFGIIGEQDRPLAIITPIKFKNPSLEGLTENLEKSLAFLPKNTPKNQRTESGKTFKLDIKNIPFSSGFHLIINQKDWWRNDETPEEKSILIGDIKLIPLCENEWGYIKTIESEQQFGLSINQNGVVKVEIWRGNLPPIDINSLSPGLSETFEFTEYKAGEIMKFETLSELVVSLDENVVKKAILVEYHPKNSLKEYFVFILAQE